MHRKGVLKIGKWPIEGDADFLAEVISRLDHSSDYIKKEKNKRFVTSKGLSKIQGAILKTLNPTDRNIINTVILLRKRFKKNPQQTQILTELQRTNMPDLSEATCSRRIDKLKAQGILEYQKNSKPKYIYLGKNFKK